MEITKENLHTAIAALKQCAKENRNVRTDTGCIVVSNLCDDVARFLESLMKENNSQVPTSIKELAELLDTHSESDEGIECAAHQCYEANDTFMDGFKKAFLLKENLMEKNAIELPIRHDSFGNPYVQHTVVYKWDKVPKKVQINVKEIF